MTSNVTLEEAVMMTGIFSCGMCNYDTEVESELKDHESKGVHMTENQQTFTCQECTFVFKDELSLRNHITNMHEQESQSNENTGDNEKDEVEESDPNLRMSVVICSSCDKGFETEKDCMDHMATHNEPELYICKKWNSSYDISQI